jgi:amino acid transporter
MNSQIKNNLNVGKSAAWADAPLLVSCVLVAAVELASLLLRAVNSPALSQGPALVLTKILILLPNPGGLPSLLTGSARFRSKIAVWMVGALVSAVTMIWVAIGMGRRRLRAYRAFVVVCAIAVGERLVALNELLNPKYRYPTFSGQWLLWNFVGLGIAIVAGLYAHWRSASLQSREGQLPARAFDQGVPLATMATAAATLVLFLLDVSVMIQGSDRSLHRYEMLRAVLMAVPLVAIIALAFVPGVRKLAPRWDSRRASLACSPSVAPRSLLPIFSQARYS